MARARTSLVRNRLDAPGKGSVLQFSYESGLITKERLVLDLRGANLRSAHLSGAHVSGANLSFAKLRRASLSEADIGYTDLTEADLTGADLSRARGVTQERLEQQADYLEGATMPNGQKYEDWLKSKGSGEDGENDNP